jgi:hypothetical protein
MERRYKFRLLVEGDCEAENLPRIINALELPFYISKDDVFNIKGAGELSKNRIELILAEYIKNNISTYVIMDNDSGTRKRLEDLVRMNLLDSNHVYIFKKAFEDSFPVEAIVRSLRMMPELELEYISSEQIKRILLSEKLLVKEIDRIQIESKSAFRLSDYKLKFSNLLSINLIELYEEGKLKRKRTEILTLLRKITKLLDQERKEFYYE